MSNQVSNRERLDEASERQQRHREKPHYVRAPSAWSVKRENIRAEHERAKAIARALLEQKK